MKKPAKPTGVLPDSVVIDGITYRVTRGALNDVVFTDDPGVGLFTRMTFDRRVGKWYVRIDGRPRDDVKVSHVVAAMKVVEEAFGGDRPPPEWMPKQ